MEPVLTMPVPPAPLKNPRSLPPAPPVTAPLLESVVMLPAFETPTPAPPPAMPDPPTPPWIVPLLVSVVNTLAFDTAAAPAPPPPWLA